MASKAERERAAKALVDAATDYMTTCTGSVGIVQIGGINVTVQDIGKRAVRIERNMFERLMDAVFDPVQESPTQPVTEPAKGRYPPTPDRPVYEAACRPFASEAEARRLAGCQAVADSIAAQGGPRIPVDRPDVQLQIAGLTAGLRALAAAIGPESSGKMIAAMSSAEDMYVRSKGYTDG